MDYGRVIRITIPTQTWSTQLDEATTPEIGFSSTPPSTTFSFSSNYYHVDHNIYFFSLIFPGKCSPGMLKEMITKQPRGKSYST